MSDVEPQRPAESTGESEHRRRDLVRNEIFWRVLRGESVRPAEIAEETGVGAKTVRESCRAMADDSLETDPILTRDGQSHTYEPAVTLVRADGLDDLALHYLQDIVKDERGEFGEA